MGRRKQIAVVAGVILGAIGLIFWIVPRGLPSPPASPSFLPPEARPVPRVAVRPRPPEALVPAAAVPAATGAPVAWAPRVAVGLPAGIVTNPALVRVLSPDYFAAAPVLDSRETPVPSMDRLVRVRLLRAGGKYPLVRVEELVERTARGERVLSRVAMVADHILVQTREGATGEALRGLNRTQGGSVRRGLHRPGLYLVAFEPAGLDTVPDQIAAYARDKNTAFAEPDYLAFPTDTIPNDPSFASLWGMTAIQAPAAWDLATGSGESVIGVIDTGLDSTHPDIAGNVWVNPHEIPGNGIDDDGNGYVDDVSGWNFLNDSNTPLDDDGHGSHVSGTIAAQGSNGVGVAGVLWHAKIMPLKFMGPAGGATSDAVDALQYATMMRTNGVKIRVTSNSWGGGGYSAALRQAIAAAGQSGQLFLAAAGNDGKNNDAAPSYPASYGEDNVIAVAAIQSSESLAGYSNYGFTSVDLAAPGSGVLSLNSSGGYATLSGTSMATPHVAGAAALLWDVLPTADYAEVKRALLASVDVLPSLQGKMVSGGRLNLYQALGALRPEIRHIPLENTASTTTPYIVEATILPAITLDTNRLLVAWNTSGATNAFVTNSLVALSNDVYRGEIPAQPMGTQIHYFLSAETTGGTVTRDPPTGLYEFQISPPVLLWITGAPDEVGEVTPAYGVQYAPSGLTIRASASPYAAETTGQRYACTGWMGIGGSVPAVGTSNQVTFTIEGATGLEWQWQKQYRLAQTSGGGGPIATSTWWQADAMATTVWAPDTFSQGGTNYHFGEWRVDGARWPAATNMALNPAAGIAMKVPRDAVAVYLPENEDTDGDLLADWWERRCFGSLSPAADDDPDADGYRNLEEFLDGTNPGDPASVPAPPAIAHTPLPDPQSSPAPWTIVATVTDNFTVAGVTLFWRRLPLGWQQAPMQTNAGPGQYAGIIPAPGIHGDRYQYRIEAHDAAGYSANSGPFSFDVAYPEMSLTLTNFTDLLRPETTTNHVFQLANSGNTSLVWSLTAGWRDTVEKGPNGWTPGGVNNLWHISTNRAASSAHAWYSGSDATHVYVDSMDATLTSVPLRLGTNASLTFRHWASMEYDIDIHYWDGGIVELSTNGGATYSAIVPLGGYPHLITSNPQSPFAPDTPCYGKTSGWEPAAFDLAAYAGQVVRLRFRFGSDRYSVAEGWYVDDIEIQPAMTSNAWLSISPAFGDLPAGVATNLMLSLTSSNIPTGDVEAALRFVSNDPLARTNTTIVGLRVRSPPVLTFLGAAQTSTNGAGLVTISNAVADADREPCELELSFSTNHGLSWAAPWLLSVTSAVTGASVSNGATAYIRGLATQAGGVPLTNLVATVWRTTDSLPPPALVPEVLICGRAWDGLYWSPTVTSATFMVDNDPPSGPIELDVTTHVARVWSTNRTIGVRWAAATDGVGGGIAGYGVVVTNSESAVAPLTVQSVGSLGSGTTPADGSNIWVAVRAVDIFGNSGPSVHAGPFFVDTTPPSAAGAVVGVRTSDWGAYVVGGSVTGSWAGFTDTGSGLADYYFAWSPDGLTNSAAWTTQSVAVLAVAPPDLNRTNTLYVRARDSVGLVGAAAQAKVLVLDRDTDVDRDGMTSGDEETAGTDATDANSALRLSVMADGRSTDVARIILSWPTRLGREYSLYRRTSLTNGVTWDPLSPFTNLPGSGGTAACADDVGSAEIRFYRIGVRVP